MTRRTALLAAATSARPYAFEYWDVFTKRRFTGNPLAVFTNAAGLDKERMLEIARETNLSETTFIFGTSPKGVRTRIFTPVTEYDFAGHPTLGTAMSLWRRGMTKVVLDLNIGPVPVEYRVGASGMYGEMVQPEPKFAETHEHAVIAKLIGLPVGELDARHPIQNVSTGRPNLVVLLPRAEALKSLRPDWRAIADYFATGDPARGFYFLTPETERGGRFRARKLNSRGEDPVTGSAAGSAIAWLVSRKLVASGERIVIEQGADVARPGELHVSAEASGSVATQVKVGGYCVKAWTGQMPGSR
ncbi:MAG: PhzF family phenazine biosynthesis protein [Bryobacteraceae bacterium]|nr:PhzF family phenazine biosynthesis protein [Bryobacteraceae bacterium]